MKTQFLRRGLLALLAAVTLALLVYTGLSSNQSSSLSLRSASYDFDYSYDGQSWQPLEDPAALRGTEERLYLKGHLLLPLPPMETELMLYLDHLLFSFRVNGEPRTNNLPVYDKMRTDMCGSVWYPLVLTIAPEDLIEIDLQNMHPSAGNHAFEDFVTSIYAGDKSLINQALLSENMASRQMGVALLATSLILLGLCCTAALARYPLPGQALAATCLAFFYGGIFLLDTQDISLLSHHVLFNTNALCLCALFSAFSLLYCISVAASGRAKKAMGALLILSALADCAAILLAFSPSISFCDLLPYWSVLQLPVFLCAAACCVSGLRQKQSTLRRAELSSYLLLCCAMLVDLSARYIGWWEGPLLQKHIAFALFCLWMLFLLGKLPGSIRAYKRAKELETELEEHRIAIMLSQIQPHFLFNSLTAIRHMCKDSPQARDAIKNFADYLRGNLNSLDSRSPIEFEQELRHIRTYLSLEELRFGSELRIEYDVAATNFRVPSLSIQPIVENAVKHGVGKAPNGGTVSLRTRERADCFEILIHDDGVGFDPSAKPQDGRRHIGIENARKRLQYMVGGTLEIQSAPGRGTQVTIRIPKEGAK
ncbi:MAG: histidine kinase [Eubacteriales bacterium]|nr:histidine kinase [Eubacteriales bacterium]